MRNNTVLNVDLAQRSYPIHIGSGLLENADALSAIDFSGQSVFILSDKNVVQNVEKLVHAIKDSAKRIETLSIAGGEKAKSHQGLEEVLDWLLDHKVDRSSILIVLGGGVLGDLGGFAASIILRGIPFIQVPTTLLAQVDSSVGGKTGINAAQGKNLIGSFYQPRTVLCDLDVLSTLSRRELLAGYAEIVKYGLLGDEEFFVWLEQNGSQVLALEPASLTEAVQRSCQAKADIVAEDEKESGKRALLNLGHTFGHALEAAAGYDGRLLHGEAVAIGMVMAFELSAQMGLCSQEDPSRVAAHIKDAGLPAKISDQDDLNLKQSAEEIVQYMYSDKKASGGKIGFILVRGIGQAFQTSDVDMNAVTEIVRKSME